MNEQHTAIKTEASRLAVMPIRKRMKAQGLEYIEESKPAAHDTRVEIAKLYDLVSGLQSQIEKMKINIRSKQTSGTMHG